MQSRSGSRVQNNSLSPLFHIQTSSLFLQTHICVHWRLFLVITNEVKDICYKQNEIPMLSSVNLSCHSSFVLFAIYNIGVRVDISKERSYCFWGKKVQSSWRNFEEIIHLEGSFWSYVTLLKSLKVFYCFIVIEIAFFLDTLHVHMMSHCCAQWKQSILNILYSPFHWKKTSFYF